MKKDLTDRTDVQILVDTFYTRVREDAILGSIFNSVIADRWPEHLAKMYDFWETVLFASPAYRGSPFPKHAKLPVSKEHFDQWLNLFNKTIDDLFVGEKAEEARWRGQKMADLFLHKIEYYQLHPNKLLF